ncbi:MAG: hypothetical protein FJ303_01310 [Planctomycetes bacterium]|nr:hypothetical protein [Planctomycetota bacterium]
MRTTIVLGVGVLVVVYVCFSLLRRTDESLPVPPKTAIPGNEQKPEAQRGRWVKVEVPGWHPAPRALASLTAVGAAPPGGAIPLLVGIWADPPPISTGLGGSIGSAYAPAHVYYHEINEESKNDSDEVWAALACAEANAGSSPQAELAAPAA